MLPIAVFFFTLGLSTIVMGANGFAGVALDASKVLGFIFLLLAVMSFILSLLGPKRAIHW